jgi:HSP20 family protein
MALVRNARNVPSRYQLDDPFSAFDRLFQDLGGSVGSREDMVYPMDLYEDNDVLTIELAIPGVQSDDLDISIEGRQLTIRATMPPIPEGEQRRYWMQGIPRGPVTRTIRLPANVDTENVKANVHDGMLMLRIPKAAEAKVRKVEIEKG